jgi:hypothetical protein
MAPDDQSATESPPVLRRGRGLLPLPLSPLAASSAVALRIVRIRSLLTSDILDIGDATTPVNQEVYS